MADCDKCLNEKRIVSLEDDLRRNSQQHKEFYDSFTHTKVEQAKIDANQNQILLALAKIEVDVVELKGKPTKRWESAVSTIITCLITGVVGVMLGILFQGGV